MTSQVGCRDRIDLANAVLKNQNKTKDEQKLYYKWMMSKHKGYFDILNDISKHFSLVQLMDSLGNVNPDISVVEYWISVSRYEKSLVLNRELLDIIHHVTRDYQSRV